jgi:hypothetical protein
MATSRRDFIKLVGVSMASLLLTRCRFPIGAACYAPLPPPSPTPTPRGLLRDCWLRFDELVQSIRSSGGSEDALGGELTAAHRLALDELVSAGELPAPVADLVQEAYEAAVYHVWRSNASITCYEPMIVDYAPEGADLLVQQSRVLNELSAQGTIDPATLAAARAALEHDLAYYELSDEAEQALYERILADTSQGGGAIPAFDDLELEITPEARAAAQFITDLLAGR